MNINSGQTDRRLPDLESVFREHGLNITPQRVAIYKELASSKEHPSAVMVFNKVREYYSNISLDTVNRTLLTFQEIGLAKVIESAGGPKRFDGDIEPHHHFQCLQCGKIIDFKCKSCDTLEVPPEVTENFIVTDKRVHLEGICDICRADK